MKLAIITDDGRAVEICRLRLDGNYQADGSDLQEYSLNNAAFDIPDLVADLRRAAWREAAECRAKKAAGLLGTLRLGIIAAFGKGGLI